MGDEAIGALGPEWAAAVAGVEREALAWRRAHPRATLTELEEVTDALAGRLQRRLLEGLAPEGEAAGAAGRPACPRCRAPMERRGTKRRAVLVARQPEPLRVEGAYYACPACGAGLSPPRRGAGAGPRRPQPPRAGGRRPAGQ